MLFFCYNDEDNNLFHDINLEGVNMETLSANEIFTPGTQPDITYNSRSTIGIENKLEKALYIKGKMIVISGKSKLGKTVLVKQKFSEDKRIMIEQSDIEDKPIERVILEKLGLSSTEQIEKKKNIFTGGVSGEVSAQVPSTGFLQFLKGKLSLSSSDTTEITQEIQTTLHQSLFDLTIEYLISNEIALVFDDFHYLEPEKQKEIIHRLKEPISRNLKVILVLIPMRQNQPIEVETDMKGRIEYIEVFSWSNSELEYIATEGFKALNVEIDDRLIQLFIDNSFSNPSLMQDICLKYCLENDILETQESKKKLDYNVKLAEGVFRDINTGENTIVRKLIEGKPTKGRPRKNYKYNGNLKGDIYVVILYCISKLCSKDKISFNELVDKVKKEDAGIQQNQISNTLNNINSISENDKPEEPVILYKDNQIMIDNDMFKFSLNWGSEAIWNKENESSL